MIHPLSSCSITYIIYMTNLHHMQTTIGHWHPTERLSSTGLQPREPLIPSLLITGTTTNKLTSSLSRYSIQYSLFSPFAPLFRAPLHFTPTPYFHLSKQLARFCMPNISVGRQRAARIVLQQLIHRGPVRRIP